MRITAERIALLQQIQGSVVLSVGGHTSNHSQLPQPSQEQSFLVSVAYNDSTGPVRKTETFRNMTRLEAMQAALALYPNARMTIRPLRDEVQ